MSCIQCGAMDERSHVGVHITPSHRDGLFVVASPDQPGIVVSGKPAVRPQRNVASRSNRQRVNEVELWRSRGERRNRVTSRRKADRRQLRHDLREAY